MQKISLDADKDAFQRSTVMNTKIREGAQTAVEAVYHIRDQYPTCSIFWVPADDASHFKEACRQIGKALVSPGIY